MATCKTVGCHNEISKQFFEYCDTCFRKLGVGPKFEEQKRKERFEPNCGKCGGPANPNYKSNNLIIYRSYSYQYIRCEDCAYTFQFHCAVCNRSAVKGISKIYTTSPNQLECQKCDKLSVLENALAEPEACITKYPPGSKFKAKKPDFMDLLDNPPLEETPLDETGKMLRRVYRPTKIVDDSEINRQVMRTVEINRLPRVKGRKSKRGVYHRSWLTLLADYEQFISSNFKLVKVEIDRWKCRGHGYGEIYYNYPIIIHYHFIVEP